MECKSELGRFASGDMEGARQAELLSHIAHCDDCRGVLRLLMKATGDDKTVQSNGAPAGGMNNKIWVILALAIAFTAIIAAMKINSELRSGRGHIERLAPAEERQEMLQVNPGTTSPAQTNGPGTHEARTALVEALGAAGRCNEAMLNTMILDRDKAPPALLGRAFMANADCRAGAGEYGYAREAYRNIAQKFPDLADQARIKLQNIHQQNDGG